MKHKLQIFKTVAYHSSFTKAAEQLFISQPAVSKAIRSLENDYKTTFFNRTHHAVQLTPDGTSFLIYVNKILDIYAEIDTQFLSKKEDFSSHINFGASTTIASYIIPKLIAKYRLQFPQTSFHIESENSEAIESLILNQQLDFGITEGKNSNRKLQYKPFIKDEIVLVTNAKNTSHRKGIISSKTLQELPIIEREIGSGTRDIIYEFLQTKNIKQLNNVVTLNSTEAIKNYLYYSNSYALISIHAVSDDLIQNKLKVIDIKDVTIERWFYFVSRTGYQSEIMNNFEQYMRLNYNF